MTPEPIQFPHSLPEWVDEILDGITTTDGIDGSRWTIDKDGDYTIEIDYGVENFSFRAGTDGENHGVIYDSGSIHDMTTPDQIQWWIAGELYDRLQKLRTKYAEDVAALNERLISRREAYEQYISKRSKP